jgi:hypothetical protein
VAHFADGLEGKLLAFGSILAWIGLVWHAYIGAEHVNAGLPVFFQSSACHGVYSGLVAAQLVRCGGEAFVQSLGTLLCKRPVQLIALRLQRLVQLLALFGERRAQCQPV